MYDAEFKTGSHALFNGVIKPSSNLDKLTDAFLFLLRWCGLPIWLRLKIRYQEILSLWVLSSSIFAVDNFELISHLGLPHYTSLDLACRGPQHTWFEAVQPGSCKTTGLGMSILHASKGGLLPIHFLLGSHSSICAEIIYSTTSIADLSAQPEVWLSRAATPEDRCLWCMERTASAGAKCIHSPFITSCKFWIVFMQY